MLNPIARFFEPLLRLLFPPGGQRRQGEAISHPALLARRRLVGCCSVVPLASPPPNGANGPLVRSRAQAAHLRWERTELRLRRQRRRALWLAVHGVDVGPRVIHGVAVAR